jgi:WD40 repeat protein
MTSTSLDRNNAGLSSGARPIRVIRMRADRRPHDLRGLAVTKRLRRSNIVAVLTAGLVGAPMVSTSGRADEKGPPTIDAVWLRDCDVSRDIPSGMRPREPLTQKPRSIPGYDELRNALWSGGPNYPASVLANGADPNCKSKEGDPILHYAVWCNHLEQIEDLLRAGADPNLVDKNGSTPLGGAIWNGNEKAVALLLKYGADPLRKLENGKTDLDNARWWDNKKIVAVLEAKRPDPIAPKPIHPPAVLRRPDKVFGSARFRAAGGGQALVYTADGKQLIAGDARGGIRFFDAKTGELRNVIAAHESEVFGLARIPNSNILVSSGGDRTTRFWDIDTSQELMRLKWGSHGISVSPDGRFLYTGYHVWEIESVKPLKLAPRGRELKGPNSWSGTRWSFFTPNSRYLVIGREADGIYVWDLAKDQIHKIKEFTPEATKTITWKDLADAVEIGKAKPTDRLALGSDQYTVVTAAPEVLDAFSKTVEAVTRYVRAMACSPDGQFLATLGYDSRIDVYDLENKRQKYPHVGHTAGVQAVAASPDGKLIASGSDDQTARIWDRETGKQLEEIPTGSFVYSVRFSPDSKLLAIGDNASNLYLWDVKERSLQTYSTSGRITGLAFDSRGEVLVSIGDDLHVFDVKTRTTRVKTSAWNAAQGPVALSPRGLIVGGTRSMSAAETFTVPNAWKLDGETLTKQKDLFSEAMGHRSFIQSVAFSPNGSLLAASSDGAIRLWDMNQKKVIGGKMCGHTYTVGDLRFSPDGKWLASASWDGTARLWEIPSGRHALVLEADVDRISGIDFTPDGHLVTANWDGTVHLWDLPKLRAVGEGK